MVLITFKELFDLIIMTAALGYIFMHSIPRPRTVYQVAGSDHGFDWHDFLFAVFITAPGIVLHELMHKFSALLFGLQAQFHASYFGLFLGIFLKWIHSPLILFVPGYVELAKTTPLLTAITAFAGPAMNLLLFVVAKIVLERAKKLSRQQAIILYMTKQINLFLFIFNMLPIPPFDGSKVVWGLYKVFF